MLKQLRIKFICINMVLVTVMLCAIFGLVLHFTQQSLWEETNQMMVTIARNPFRQDLPGETGLDSFLPYFAVQQTSRGDLNVVSGGSFNLSSEYLLEEIFEIAFSSMGDVGELPEYHLRYLRVKNIQGNCIVFVDVSSEYQTMQNLFKNCLAIGAISFFAFLMISFLLAFWAVKPVERAWKQQTQFVADASHELKTPLTVLLTNAELLQDASFDAETKSRLSFNILEMTRQMRGLVESLLELARADNGIPEKSFTRVDWSSLVEQTMLPFEPVFFEAGLQLESDLAAELIVQGSQGHLRQVLEILLDNARKYSAPNSTVSVRLMRQGKNHGVLSVSSAGAALTPEEQKNIFKRFYRTDTVRTSNGSFGLGLPIAESIVRTHHGKIWVESTENKNIFMVRLPLTETIH